jgi:hypothetical protein
MTIIGSNVCWSIYFLIILIENDRLQPHILRPAPQRTHLQLLLQVYLPPHVEECNVGLCATCICSHTETHIQKRTAPEYENIRTTYSKMQDSIRSRISAFEQEKSRIVPTLTRRISSSKPSRANANKLQRLCSRPGMIPWTS